MSSASPSRVSRDRVSADAFGLTDRPFIRRDVPIATADHARRWAVVTFFVVAGYMTLQRSFAHVLSVPGVPVYASEVLLIAFFVLHPDVSIRRLLNALVRPGPLGALAWAMFLVLAYGLILAVRGYVSSYPTLFVSQELVFNLYPLYILLGLWLAERNRQVLERFVLGLSWVVGVYGALYVAFLNHSATTVPGTDLELFRPPLGQGAMLLALLAFRPKGARMWVPFSLNLFVLLGIQSRAAYAGFLTGLLVWAVMSKRIGRMVLLLSMIAGLLAAAWMLDLRVEFLRGGSEYSAGNVIAAVVAPFDEEAAARFSPDARSFAGTVEWRRAWWSGIWDATHADAARTAIGTGYGFELTSDAHLRSSDPLLRTPHNWFMYSLGYGGWLGVALFVFLLVSLGTLLWRGDRISGVPLGLPFLVLSTTIATFSNFYETPFAAIPVWVISGMAIAPAVREASVRSAKSASGRDRSVRSGSHREVETSPEPSGHR
jgi:O-Antigen ligase